MADIDVEIAFASIDRQWLQNVRLEEGSTIRDVIHLSGIQQDCPGIDLAALAAGIWGNPVSHEHVVKPGDRVELYRALALNPRDARRQLALLGRTMNDPNPD